MKRDELNKSARFGSQWRDDAIKNLPEKIYVIPMAEKMGIYATERASKSDIEYTRSVNTDEDMTDFAEWLELEGYRVKGWDASQRRTILKLFREEKEKQKQLNQK